MLLRCYTLVAALYWAAQATKSVSPSHKWALIVDAGSSGSRMHMFHWAPVAEAVDPPRLEQYTPSDKSDEKALKVEPGISSYSVDPTAVESGLTSLLQQGHIVCRGIFSVLCYALCLAHATASWCIYPCRDHAQPLHVY